METYDATIFDNYDVLKDIDSCKYVECSVNEERSMFHFVGGLNGGYRATVITLPNEGIGVGEGGFGRNMGRCFPVWYGSEGREIRQLIGKLLRRSGYSVQIFPLEKLPGFVRNFGVITHERGGFVISGEYALRLNSTEYPDILSVKETEDAAVPAPKVYDTSSGIYIDFGDAGWRIIHSRKEFFDLEHICSIANRYIYPVVRQGDILFVPAKDQWENEDVWLGSRGWWTTHRPSQPPVGYIRVDERSRMVFREGTVFQHNQHPEVTLCCDCAAIPLPGYTRRENNDD